MRAITHAEVLELIVRYAEETRKLAEACYEGGGCTSMLLADRAKELKRLRALAETAQ